jgi:hypothetical protein
MHELYDINISDSNVESALGYNQSNADDLMRQIYEKLPYQPRISENFFGRNPLPLTLPESHSLSAF